MTGDVFLQLGGVAGESVTRGYEHQIEVLSWDWGVAQSGMTRTGGGAGAGKVSVRDLSFTHHIDAASTKLILACCRGTHIRKALLSVTAPGLDSAYFTISLRDLLVTSVSDASSEGRPIEAVSLAFDAFDIRYQEQLPDGSLGEISEAEWNLNRNA